MAKLYFKYGAMNSGKSDTLLKTAFNYTERGLTVIIIKPAIDSKGGAKIVTRAGYEKNVDILAGDDMNLEKEVLKNNNVAVVLVDESQFLTHEHISQLFHLAKGHDISVICYGLRADFRTEMFPGSKRLFEVADNIEKLPTMCFCGSQAEFNTRKLNGEYVFRGDQVAIDGEDKVEYDPLCGKCYQREGGVI